MNKAKELSSPIDKAVFDYKLIEDGDRILIGASGGKDSTELLDEWQVPFEQINVNTHERVKEGHKMNC